MTTGQGVAVYNHWSGSGCLWPLVREWLSVTTGKILVHVYDCLWLSMTTDYWSVSSNRQPRPTPRPSLSVE